MKRPISTAAFALVIALAGAGGMAACTPPPPKCEGQAPTITGTSGVDTLNGTSGPDVIVGLGGNDTINGLGGGDLICGDAGNDVVVGAAGDDTLVGGDGTDTASYAALATPVNANLATGVATGDGTDTLRSLENLTGGSGNDTLTGDSAGNTLSGGAGNDTLNGSGANDTCDVGAGTDTASNCEAVSGSVDSLTNQDTFTNGLASGQRLFLDSAIQCPGGNILLVDDRPGRGCLLPPQGVQ